MDSELDAKIAGAPRSPGVYLMKDGAGEILYVGKARDLLGFEAKIDLDEGIRRTAEHYRRMGS